MVLVGFEPKNLGRERERERERQISNVQNRCIVTGKLRWAKSRDSYPVNGEIVRNRALVEAIFEASKRL